MSTAPGGQNVEAQALLAWLNARLSEMSPLPALPATPRSQCPPSPHSPKPPRTLTSLSDLSDSVSLITLCEQILGHRTGKYWVEANTRIKKIDNATMLFKILRELNIRTTLGAEDIADCNHKQLLGLCWAIVRRCSLAPERNVPGAVGESCRINVSLPEATVPNVQEVGMGSFAVPGMRDLSRSPSSITLAMDSAPTPRSPVGQERSQRLVLQQCESVQSQASPREEPAVVVVAKPSQELLHEIEHGTMPKMPPLPVPSEGEEEDLSKERTVIGMVFAAPEPRQKPQERQEQEEQFPETTQPVVAAAADPRCSLSIPQAPQICSESSSDTSSPEPCEEGHEPPPHPVVLRLPPSVGSSTVTPEVLEHQQQDQYDPAIQEIAAPAAAPSEESQAFVPPPQDPPAEWKLTPASRFDSVPGDSPHVAPQDDPLLRVPQSPVPEATCTVPEDSCAMPEDVPPPAGPPEIRQQVEPVMSLLGSAPPPESAPPGTRKGPVAPLGVPIAVGISLVEQQRRQDMIAEVPPPPSPSTAAQDVEFIERVPAPVSPRPGTGGLAPLVPPLGRPVGIVQPYVVGGASVPPLGVPPPFGSVPPGDAVCPGKPAPPALPPKPAVAIAQPVVAPPSPSPQVAQLPVPSTPKPLPPPGVVAPPPGSEVGALGTPVGAAAVVPPLGTPLSAYSGTQKSVAPVASLGTPSTALRTPRSDSGAGLEPSPRQQVVDPMVLALQQQQQRQQMMMMEQAQQAQLDNLAAAQPIMTAYGADPNVMQYMQAQGWNVASQEQQQQQQQAAALQQALQQQALQQQAMQQQALQQQYQMQMAMQQQAAAARGSPNRSRQASGAKQSSMPEPDSYKEPAQSESPSGVRRKVMPKPSPEAYLYYKRDGKLQSYKLTAAKRVVTIGRHSEVDIQITKTDQSISRWHATVTAVSAGKDSVQFLFKDNSTYGSFINDRQTTDCELHDGDKIFLGTSEEMILFIRPNTCAHPSFEAAVTKHSNAFRKWQGRWMCLTRDLLFYFKSRDDVLPTGIIDLHGVLLNDAPKPKNSFVIVTQGKSFHFCAKNAAEKAAWMASIEKAISQARSNPSQYIAR